MLIFIYLICFSVLPFSNIFSGIRSKTIYWPSDSVEQNHERCSVNQKKEERKKKRAIIITFTFENINMFFFLHWQLCKCSKPLLCIVIFFRYCHSFIIYYDILRRSSLAFSHFWVTVILFFVRNVVTTRRPINFLLKSDEHWRIFG